MVNFFEVMNKLLVVLAKVVGSRRLMHSLHRLLRQLQQMVQMVSQAIQKEVKVIQREAKAKRKSAVSFSLMKVVHGEDSASFFMFV